MGKSGAQFLNWLSSKGFTLDECARIFSIINLED
jgi:hypothetical protein